jgi:Pup amidohydrolase
MIEDDYLVRTFVLANPVQAIRQVSYDLSLRRPIELDEGRSITALEMQWELYDRARKYADDRGLEAVGQEAGEEVLRRWEYVLTALESDPLTLADQLDWVAKYRVINGYRERHGAAWSDARLAAMDLQYHDLRPEKSLFSRLGMEKLVDDDDAVVAISEPPPDTRAYFRGKCLQKWADDIVAANWDSMVFDVGDDPLRRVPMMEPTRGTAAHVGNLLEECTTSAELLRRLGT